MHQAGGVAHLSSAITANALQSPYNATQVPCEVIQKKNDTLNLIASPVFEYEVAVVICGDGEIGLPADVNITVDYTGLVANVPNEAEDTVAVYLGLTEDITKVYHNTDPILLVPGAHLLTFADRSIRQRLKQATFTAFGLEVSSPYNSRYGRLW